ncbi:MAG TPA: hypothetical protein VFR32_05010 [Gaiellaceae bacterium]|nr:hypothetical protein [Gaiellaceae bacterium]
MAAPVRLDGRPAGTEAFEGFSRLREAIVELPGDAPAELHVWAHRVSPYGGSEAVPVEVGVDGRRVVIGT